MIDRLDNDFAGVRNIYDHLSEYVHPNYEGLAKAYSQPVRSEDRIVFLSNMRPVVDDTIPAIVKICTHILTTNYNERFIDGFDRLERWLNDNDAELSKEKWDSE